MGNDPGIHNEDFLTVSTIREVQVGEELYFVYGPDYDMDDNAEPLRPQVHRSRGES